jgi:hypothetical protein
MRTEQPGPNSSVPVGPIYLDTATLPVSSAADAIFIGESRPQNVLTYVIAVPARFRRLGMSTYG